MPLHLDYRPQTFEEIVGNKAVVSSLKSVLSRQDRPHSYLFTGPSGCGKTTLARLLAKGLGCEELELHELNAANTRGIDTIRDVIQSGFYAPLSGSVKVFLFDECQELPKITQDAMLKMLEDSPTYVYNILCTTNPTKVLHTIKTRCTTYGVVSLTSIEMQTLLTWVLTSEKVELSKAVQTSIISASDGCPRKLLVMLDQIINIVGEQDQLDAIINTTDEAVEIIDICRKLISKDSTSKKWIELSEKLKKFDQDPEQTRRAVLGYMSKVILNSKGEDGKRIALLMAEFVNNYYDSGKSGLIVSCYMACLI